MGCCAARKGQVHQEKDNLGKDEKETSINSVNYAQTVKQQLVPQRGSRELNEFIGKLREVYYFQSEKHYLFDSTNSPQINEIYTFQTKTYIVQCKISDANIERLATFNFALIAPQWQQQQHSPPFFIYCVEKRSSSAQVLPVLVKIQSNKVQLQQKKFQFTANLNNIIKLILQVQIKEPTS